MNHLMNIAVGTFVGRAFREEIRNRGLKALRAYIEGVGKVRTGAMLMTGLISVVALLVAGVILVFSAIVAMLPLTPAAMSWIALISGAILMFIGIMTLSYLFSQKRWLKQSRSTELIETFTDPDFRATSVPKNLAAALKRQPDHSIP